MAKRDFKTVYAEAKADLVRQSAQQLQAHLAAAIDAVAAIMTDKDVAPQTRLQAAQVIIKQAGVFADRLHGLDTIVQGFTSNNPFRVDFD